MTSPSTANTLPGFRSRITVSPASSKRTLSNLKTDIEPVAEEILHRNQKLPAVGTARTVGGELSVRKEMDVAIFEFISKTVTVSPGPTKPALTSLAASSSSQGIESGASKLPTDPVEYPGVPSSLSQSSSIPSETGTHWLLEHDAPLAEQRITHPEQLSLSTSSPFEFTKESNPSAELLWFFMATSYLTDSAT